MLLVIPRIDIRDGECVFSSMCSDAEPAHVFRDPVQMAQLWRIQNARTLHVVDLNGMLDPEDRTNQDVIRRLCSSVDIPVQFEGGLDDEEKIAEALACGAYRVVVGSTDGGTNRVRGYVERFGDRRITAHLRVSSEDPSAIDRALTAVRALDAMGCRRIIVTALRSTEGVAEPVLRLDLLKACADAMSGAHITAGDGPEGFDDLIALQNLGGGVDSVILGRALYDNRFPCQALWCWHDTAALPLDHFTTARTRDGGSAA